MTGSTNTFEYENTFAGFGVALAWDTEIDDARTADGATSANNTTNVDGSNTSFAITNASLVDGLDFGVGYSETDIKDGTSTTSDIESIVGYANYTVGPVTIGYTQAEQSGGTQGHDMHSMEAYGIVFAINESLSDSYNNHEVTYNKTAGNTDISAETDGIAIAYSMGGASVKIQNNESSGNTSSATYEEDRTEVNLSLAF